MVHTLNIKRFSFKINIFSCNLIKNFNFILLFYVLDIQRKLSHRMRTSLKFFGTTSTAGGFQDITNRVLITHQGYEHSNTIKQYIITSLDTTLYTPLGVFSINLSLFCWSLDQLLYVFSQYLNSLEDYDLKRTL